jgi:hypothetical protein
MQIQCRTIGELQFNFFSQKNMCVCVWVCAFSNIKTATDKKACAHVCFIKYFRDLEIEKKALIFFHWLFVKKNS